jgi:sialic acid synthase SpsE
MAKNIRFKIGSRWVGNEEPLYVIAEAGVNHENEIQVALEMITKAKEAGADAIKFQSYKAARLASRYSPAYWDQTKEPANSQYDLFTRYDGFNASDYFALAKHAEEVGITFLTTAFDELFVDQLADILPAFKVASADITHYPLLKRIASKGKPVILSVGAATFGEIEEAIRFLQIHGCQKLALLHCVLNYPTPPAEANLRAVLRLREVFPDVIVGYSDHVACAPSILQLSVAWMLGARIVEKHFTLNKTLPGNDHYHSMDPADLRAFRQQQAFVEALLEGEGLGVLTNQKAAREFARRSLVASRRIKADQPLTEDMIVIKRPGTGIPPQYLEVLLGARPVADIKEDTVLQWDMFLLH